MSVTTLDHGVRVARKSYRCGMCNAWIKPGNRHSATSNVYDGRAYTWRECLPCERDAVCAEVHAWSGGYYDEGVSYDEAVEWAEETVRWSANPVCRLVARRWLARAAGGEGE